MARVKYTSSFGHAPGFEGTIPDPIDVLPQSSPKVASVTAWIQWHLWCHLPACDAVVAPALKSRMGGDWSLDRKT